MTACDLRAYQKYVINTVIMGIRTLDALHKCSHVTFFCITNNYNNVPAFKDITNARRQPHSV